MAQEQQQEPSPKQPSLLTRVFGSRIAQALGILGVAFTLFQGLEPFLKFSRFMAYLVSHWREWTRGLWSWLASFVHLDIPAWALDLMTLFLFIILFTVRGIRYSISPRTFEKKSLIVKLFFATETLMDHVFERGLLTFPKTARYLMATLSFYLLFAFTFMVATMIFTYTLVITCILPIPVSIFLTMSVHDKIWALIASVVVAAIYGLVFITKNLPGLVMTSERAAFVLAGLLAMNYLALNSRTIEAFIEKATQ